MYAFLSGGTPDDPNLVVIEMTGEEARDFLAYPWRREELVAQLTRLLGS